MGTGWTVPQGPGTRPKAAASVSQGAPASVTSQNREEGGTRARTHGGNRPAAPPAGRRRRPWNQGQGLGQDLPRSGYQGGMGAWGIGLGSCQEAAGERPARGLPAQSACAERGVRSEGPGIQELEGGGCQGTNRAIARCGGRGWRPTVKGGCAGCSGCREPRFRRKSAPTWPCGVACAYPLRRERELETTPQRAADAALEPAGIRHQAGAEAVVRAANAGRPPGPS